MNILAITCVKNEGPYLVDWLAHLRAIGIDHVLAFSNDCDDGTDQLLDACAAQGWLTHHRQTHEGVRTLQWQALKTAAQDPAYHAADWIMFIDVDEYVCLSEGITNLRDLIQRADGADAIAMPWRLFGTAGRHDISFEPVTTRFTQSAPRDIALPLAHFFKTLFRRSAFREPGIHRPKPIKNKTATWVDNGLNPLPIKFATSNGRINLFGNDCPRPLVQLNHYSIRSTAEFMLKAQRGLPNKMERDIEVGYWVSRNWNDETHDPLPPPDRRAIETPEILNIETRAQNWHRRTFEKLMQDADAVQRYWQLILAGSSSAPTAEMAQAHLHRLQQAYQND